MTYVTRAATFKSTTNICQLFNDYADQAGYYNISLLLFHQADFRDLSTIRNTWQLFIEQIHNDAVAEGKASPWESVAIETETLGRRVGTNQNIFPVSDVFQLLLHYDVEKYRTAPSGVIDPEATDPVAWPIDVFAKLHAPFENLVSVLEAMWYAREQPFNSRNGRKLLAKWLVCVVEKWWEESRRSGEPFGSAENALGLSDLLRVIVESGDFTAGAGSAAEDAEWAERLRVIRVRADEIVR